MRAQKGGICIVLSIHNAVARRGWVIRTTPRSFYSCERDPVHIEQDAVWPRGHSVRVQNVSRSLGFEPWTVQPVASLYTD